MLTLDGLTLGQGDFTLNADLTIAPGTITALLGPSGAGKSTLLAGIAGFLDPRAGRVLWHGVDISTEAPGQRPVAMLFQDQNLFPHMTVVQNVGLGITTGRLGADEKAQVNTVLARVGMEGMGARRPAELSGGQQSRAALARMLMQNRPLWLLDEPFAALGPALRREMLALVSQTARQEGATLVLVTHDPDDARQVADQVILVAQSRAHAPVETKAIFGDPPPALSDYLGQ